MNPRYFFRASLGLLVLVLLGAGVLASGVATTGNAEPIASVSDAYGQSTSTEDTSDARARLDAQAAAHRSKAETVAIEAAADKEAADRRALYADLEQQAYEAEVQRQADEAAAAEAANNAAYFEALEQQAAAEAAAAAPAATSSRGSGVPADSYWDAIASCETGGNWGMTGSRYSGGVGFANSTWNAWGGQEFASNAGYATRDQQIIVANRVATQGYGSVAPVGYSGWGCVRTVGYP